MGYGTLFHQVAEIPEIECDTQKYKPHFLSHGGS